MDLKDFFEIFYDSDDCSQEIEVETNLINQDGFYIKKSVKTDIGKYTFYISPQSETSAFLLIYLSDDEPFDTIFENLDNINEAYIEKSWPLLISAIKNGFCHNYLYPSIARIDDKFWGLIIFIENIDFEYLDTEYIIEKALNLIKYGMDMLVQIDENDIPNSDMNKIKLKYFWEGAKEGYRLYKVIRRLSSLIN